MRYDISKRTEENKQNQVMGKRIRKLCHWTPNQTVLKPSLKGIINDIKSNWIIRLNQTEASVCVSRSLSKAILFN